MYPINKIRNKFPILNNTKFIYLDNAASTYKPISVINSQIDIYKNYYAPYNKGLYNSSIKITEEVESSRYIISKFINSNYNEIIFTKSATESINLVSNIIKKFLFYQDNIIISEIEHHSNIIPWKIISNQLNLNIKILKINKKWGNFDLKNLIKIINDKTKLISLSHASNILGIINNVKKITSVIKKINNKIIVFIDGSQVISHTKIDVKKINCDFYTFSGHKIYAPLGVGVLYGKKKLLNILNPWQTGGSIIKNLDLYKKTISYVKYPWKFESGSLNFISIIGLKHAINYINSIGIKKIESWEKKLTLYTIKKLKDIKNITIYCDSIKNKLSIISFNIKNINSNDLGILLNEKGICLRTDHNCSIPTMNLYKVNSMCRISYAMYTNYNEIDFFIKTLKNILKTCF